MPTGLRYLLLQTRNDNDPMAAQEVRCFSRAVGCDESSIAVVSLLSRAPTAVELKQTDMILMGGSGQYSAATNFDNTSQGEPWLTRALDCMREVYSSSRPTFASCWGFQAMARAMGGLCVNDLPNAELGTVELTLTAAGVIDPVFGQLPKAFGGQAGHEDHVIRLPDDAVLLASSEKVRERAFYFRDKPIYCTQFHPELDRRAMLERVVAYPAYVERIAKVTYDDFVCRVRETSESNRLLKHFINYVFGC